MLVPSLVKSLAIVLPTANDMTIPMIQSPINESGIPLLSPLYLNNSLEPMYTIKRRGTPETNIADIITMAIVPGPPTMFCRISCTIVELITPSLSRLIMVGSPSGMVSKDRNPIIPANMRQNPMILPRKFRNIVNMLPTRVTALCKAFPTLRAPELFELRSFHLFLTVSNSSFTFFSMLETVTFSPRICNLSAVVTASGIMIQRIR